MNDKQLKSFLFKLGAIQTALTIIVGAVIWVFSIGKASADIVKKSELAPMQADIAQLRTDVAYIRGRLETNQKGVILPP